MTGQITLIVCLSYSDLVVGAVARPGCDAQKHGGGSLPCSIANTKLSIFIRVNSNILDLHVKHYKLIMVFILDIFRQFTDIAFLLVTIFSSFFIDSVFLLLRLSGTFIAQIVVTGETVVPG